MAYKSCKAFGGAVWIRAIYPEMYYMYLYVIVQSWPLDGSSKESTRQTWLDL
jgi:hypothetical protein